MIKVYLSAVVHYQLVTIHPFEDGNGRTARLLSGYILDLNGYGFNGIGSLEEYFAYDIDEYTEYILQRASIVYNYGLHWFESTRSADVRCIGPPAIPNTRGYLESI